jgi:hypothetical protein
MCLGLTASVLATGASTSARGKCQVRDSTFEGWQAEELSNEWVKLILVPKLGGRLMQVSFGNHHYLFVNPKYKGKYFSPAEAAKTNRWINYGGDKLWPLPEGRDDDQHWPGPISDVLDDGEYNFSVVEQGQTCEVRLEGPADLRTGLQYTREISITGNSPEIRFHAVMKNASQRPIRWSVQSVTQYDTADRHDPASYNREFWAMAPVNPHSAYIDGYQVRAGLADDPSFEVRDGIFRLHWLYLENEVWLDSDSGWVAIVDNTDRYGMIERFRYVANAEYPGKASVIFYKNGAGLQLNPEGLPIIRSATPDQAPYYMEAEINSPMVSLGPGESYAMDTHWFPVRTGKELRIVTDVGVVERPLHAALQDSRVKLTGSCAVLFPGKLIARILDTRGMQVAQIDLRKVDPRDAVELNEWMTAPSTADRVEIRLMSEQNEDMGNLGEAKITTPEKKY